jgi:hypothetical protein
MMFRLAAWKRRCVMASCAAALLLGCADTKTQLPAADGGLQTGLPDRTAGTPCKADADCAHGQGSCASSLVVDSTSTAAPTPDGYCTASCSADSQCGLGGRCHASANAEHGTCLATCTTQADCRAGYLCSGAASASGVGVKGTCQPKPAIAGLADGVVGHACAMDADCQGGQCASSTALGMKYPGNYCTGLCTEDKQCGAGGACWLPSNSAVAGRCYEACTADTDCTREGYRCWKLAEGFTACYPAATPLPDHTAGMACSADSDCGGHPQSCASQLPFGSFATHDLVPAPGGYCTQTCSLDSECGAGAQCISRGIQGGMCLGSCTQMSDCRAGYTCLEHGRDHDDARVCVPAL